MFFFTPSHFLFLPLQLFEIISFPYKSELPQIRGQLLFSCINLNFNYRAHMKIIFKKDVSVSHSVACLYISSGILVFLGEPVLLSVSPNIENIPCQIQSNLDKMTVISLMMMTSKITLSTTAIATRYSTRYSDFLLLLDSWGGFLKRPL